MPSRFSKENWLDLGLTVLSKDGAKAIRIDALCKRAGRTKGSFYHHFKTRGDFVAALLSHWEQELTQSVIDQADREANPTAKLIALNQLTQKHTGGGERSIEQELRRWAGSDAGVAHVMERVDKRRVDYVASLLMQAKNISSQRAIDLAVLNYASLVGFQQMFSPVHPDRRKRIDQVFVDILNTLPDHD